METTIPHYNTKLEFSNKIIKPVNLTASTVKVQYNVTAIH